MPMTLLGDRVLVALAPRPEQIVSEGGITLVRDPDLKAQTQGIVTALGVKSDSVSIDEVLALLDETFQASSWNDDEVRATFKRLGPAPFDVMVGECVLFPASAGEEVEMDGIRYAILSESDILAVVEPEKNEAAA